MCSCNVGQCRGLKCNRFTLCDQIQHFALSEEACCKEELKV